MCVGLDPDWDRIPAHLHRTDDPIYEFNKAIIETTKDLAVAYKPNLAFYESRGAKGWASLEKTL
ncbi:bifunctional orotidine-5'-phosphate decarboxylase/orotate phosphoribosyltransferase, partial [Arthrospira platensis SPKY1]|nr:bifunctional orotidine-5'-phosphate decarboxylase/orotate phosphoribosyltransferase [Arthrospira platensis SPKY1]